MNKKIVITGIGVVASNGIGKDVFWSALQKGESGIKPVSLFDTDFMRSKLAGEIKDFDAKIYLGEKGLRLLDRATKLVNVAAKLALDDSGFRVTEENTDRVGVVLGTTLGSVWSISEFDKTALKEGPRYVNPALFPNTVINSPASQISIRFKIKGFNTTISTGFTSALDALKYACDFIDMGRADAVLVGGAEELCLQTYLGFYKLRFLSGSKEGGPEINCPFDARRNGIVFGEGAAMVLIEDEKAARARGAHIYGEIASIGYSFLPFRLNKYHKLGTGLKEAMEKALQEAGLEPKDIGHISANANSTPEADCIETQAIKEVFGKDAYRIPVSSVKSMVGETFSASGAMQLAAGLASLEKEFIPPTINYENKETCCDLDYVTEGARKARVRHVLLSCFGPSGVNNCVVLSKFK
ncbi:MAG: beta-ketoacyl-[acyl-carrier-protein] synthase family protein [Candidatus Omnitrophica bacterium]|nr:beta-ketoacyl-[acyl-carrier-protein] synthase family protein [Candidatus Omnitrophota bacterium]MDD5574318.1 beta-ketoacyl-[acyl-carrier-protein] synthase family protein [Candidatus Omnitrophota bacterium]